MNMIFHTCSPDLSPTIQLLLFYLNTRRWTSTRRRNCKLAKNHFSHIIWSFIIFSFFAADRKTKNDVEIKILCLSLLVRMLSLDTNIGCMNCTIFRFLISLPFLCNESIRSFSISQTAPCCQMRMVIIINSVATDNHCRHRQHA